MRPKRTRTPVKAPYDGQKRTRTINTNGAYCVCRISGTRRRDPLAIQTGRATGAPFTDHLHAGARSMTGDDMARTGSPAHRSERPPDRQGDGPGLQ